MPNWTNLSLEKLKVATKLDIIKAIGKYLGGLTKKQIIELLLDNVEVPDNPIIMKYLDGQLKNRKTVVRDVLGNKLRTRIIDWVYYGTGEINTIFLRKLDANDKEIERQEIKYFLDGQQPQIKV